MDSISVQ